MAPKPQPKATGIHVYDANGQYLGILMNHGGGGFIQIFAPSIGKFINAMDYEVVTLHYETNDCTGPPLVQAGATDHIYYSGYFDKYYWLMPWEERTRHSYFTSGECFASDFGYLYNPTVEIAPEELPFTLPLALPLTYEYGSR